MFKSICFGLLLLASSCNTTYYIARHAEKASSKIMSSDVPLSAEGAERAIALKDSLLHKQIKYIFSTNFTRTKATAGPLSNALNIPITTYDPNDPVFITKLHSLKGNVLIIGHSNTVDDLVNTLVGKKILNDLPDNAYGDLFIVKKGKGDVFVKHFGKGGPQSLQGNYSGQKAGRRRS
jgi:2,3-bisphosphoglycerate-dependent phosphoglycerate mutase